MATKAIIRCVNAGVFFGHVKQFDPQTATATLTDVRKIWRWSGACAVEQLSQDGVAKPRECRFTITVPEIIVTGVCQILPCSDKAVKSLSAVEEWKI